MVNVVSPSTSAGVRPQSASAASVASTESCSSERPDSLENSVAPIPAIAAAPDRRHRRRRRATDGHRAGDVVAEATRCRPRRRRRPPSVDLGHRAGEHQRVAGVRRRAEPDRDRPRARRGPGPVGDVALHQPGGGQDVEEDVLASPCDCARSRSWWTSWKSRVAMRRADHERRRHRQAPLRQLGPRPRRALMPASRRAGSGRRRSAGSRPRTGIPISTSSGSQSTSSPTIRTPSSRSTRASTTAAPARERRVVVHDVREDRAAPGRDDVRRGRGRGTRGTTDRAGAAARRRRRTAGSAARRPACPPRRTRCRG